VVIISKFDPSVVLSAEFIVPTSLLLCSSERYHSRYKEGVCVLDDSKGLQSIVPAAGLQVASIYHLQSARLLFSNTSPIFEAQNFRFNLHLYVH
jgi:hypothetical protein